MSQPDDSDLDALSREQLIAIVKDLRAGIRKHRDCAGHDLCWYSPELWSLVEEGKPLTKVPAFPEFIANCVKYRMSFDNKIEQ